MHFHNAISHFSLHSLHKCIYTFERIRIIRTIRGQLIKRKMKAMYKSELAKLAGVSNSTFYRFLKTRRSVLEAMGISIYAKKLPPNIVKYISEEYCIDL